MTFQRLTTRSRAAQVYLQLLKNKINSPAGNFEQTSPTCNKLIEMGDINQSIQNMLEYEQPLIQQANQKANQLSKYMQPWQKCETWIC
ncbi:MAG TPA: hypothetical protein DCM28_12505 [Phycisphaerales bacterium]|nr:hypothetical protein [Phycisphaerales bacterium]HCD33128.1 hypothetical protein [Phycisphaerales bacterium]